ncbi:hypothetical protein ACPRNU_22240 [Chromobacterium vaccinii]|uniref:hypothetical protein n=1 Tax=Chromobacterium vaccinii TaxID=1108595 RepID=UPI003C784ECF
MAVNDGFSIAYRPQAAWQPAAATVRVAAPAPAGPSGAAPLLDNKGREVGSPESRYGMSMQTLQLLKQYDVRNMSGKDLAVLSDLMQARGEMDGDVSAGIRGDIEAKGWKTAGNSNALEIFAKRRDQAMAEVKAGEVTMKSYDFILQGNARVQEMLNRLAGLHDALQEDDSVQAAADGGMSQAADVKRFNDWSRQQGQRQPDGPAPSFDQDTVDAVMNTLQRLGVGLPPESDLAGGADRMAQAWKSYQAWQAQHPGEQAKIDLQAPQEKPAMPPGDPQASAAPAARTEAPASPRRQADALNQRFQLEAQYGMSLPMLQVLKGVDVANASMDQLKQLGKLLQANGALSQDDADSLLPLTERGMVDPMNYYRRDLESLADAQRHGLKPQYRTPLGMADLANVAGRTRNDKQAQAVLDRLAGLHQALQDDDGVRAVAGNGLQQAGDLAAFNAWAQVEQKGARNSDDAQPGFRGRQDVDGIFRTLQRMGVELTPVDGDARVSQRLDQAWKDYQAWRGSHPGAQPALQLAPARINDFA